MVTFAAGVKDDDKTDQGNSIVPEAPQKSAAYPSSSAAISGAARRKPVMNKRSRGERFGLVQWQRLVKSSKDLAQRKGAPFRKNIPWEEIRQHNKPYDGWMVLRGTVYNVGPYLAYHPGGIDIMKKVLGKDGTELFDKYHRWVNIESLIGTLEIGSVAPS